MNQHSNNGDISTIKSPISIMESCRMSLSRKYAKYQYIFHWKLKNSRYACSNRWKNDVLFYFIFIQIRFELRVSSLLGRAGLTRPNLSSSCVWPNCFFFSLRFHISFSLSVFFFVLLFTAPLYIFPFPAYILIN